MPKKQKVRFHKGDKKPGGANLKEKDLYYTKKMVKKGRKIVWHTIEHPSKRIISEYFFEEDASKWVKFQNKNIDINFNELNLIVLLLYFN